MRRARQYLPYEMLLISSGEVLVYLNFSSSLLPRFPLLFPHKMAAAGAASNGKWISC